MMKNTVVGRPGTTTPIDPTATATQPTANHIHRTGLERSGGEGVVTPAAGPLTRRAKRGRGPCLRG
jgi:hypothetical protein